MAHFAKLNADNIVEQVIVVADKDTSDENGVEDEIYGIAFCKRSFGTNTNWKQTSYNSNMRGNYAGIGCTYMSNVATLGVGSTDIFMPTQPYASWTVSTTAARWEAPITEPTLTDDEIASGSYYTWDEPAYQSDNTTGWTLTTPDPDPE